MLSTPWLAAKAKVLIHERLSTHTSPDVISKELIQEHNIQVSESTIYRYIHEDREKGGELYKSLPHSGKPYKKKVKSGDKTKIPNRVGIKNRLAQLATFGCPRPPSHEVQHSVESSYPYR
ncbi:Transposase, IS30 family [Piscirickettsia salmonis]|uniref:hypothetical protein n=1 Tax=Piscirickettsia salmonis TaxID=1238 RepID=UPI001E4E7A55|nr:hypothetical protein [Piscirickettsia salmonis]QGP64000.1 Transposase, IS30 family [Piscirickettsia salmonis]